ncbi:MAG: hypothetical protein R3321_09935, partial [Nitrososphaeraceae archaeon]|nr:hypothetical protein [Nitrososphaeraceae archaeon]
LYAYDHFIPHFRGDIEKNIFECFTLLSSIAAITDKIKIGQVVTCNYLSYFYFINCSYNR